MTFHDIGLYVYNDQPRFPSPGDTAEFRSMSGVEWYIYHTQIVIMGTHDGTLALTFYSFRWKYSL